MGYKGYKLYDLENKKFFISRDVAFVEDVFPFPGLELIDVFPEVVLPAPLPYVHSTATFATSCSAVLAPCSLLDSQAPTSIVSPILELVATALPCR